jgi:hypothetical protein
VTYPAWRRDPFERSIQLDHVFAASQLMVSENAADDRPGRGCLGIVTGFSLARCLVRLIHRRR